MEITSFGIRTKFSNGDKGLEQKFEDGQSLALVSKVAQMNFVAPHVLSICIFNGAGKVVLFKKKLEDGTIHIENHIADFE